MKNKVIKVLITIIIFLLGICIGIVLGINKDKLKGKTKETKKPETKEKVKKEDKKEDEASKENEEQEESVNKETRKLEEHTFKNTFGDNSKSVTINAYDVKTLSGFAGATSNVYYIDKDYNLHYLELANLTDTILATDIKKLNLTDDTLTAYKNSDTKILKENDYITYE